MTKDQKIIGAKAGLIELAKQLGNVSQACKIMGFEPGQLLSVQGPLRQRGRTGAAGDVAPQADPHRTGCCRRSKGRWRAWRSTSRPGVRRECRTNWPSRG